MTLKKTAVLLVASLMIIVGLARPQVPAPAAKIELPQLPLQQKMVRVVYAMVAQTCLDIAFCKSIGKTPEDLVAFRSRNNSSWDAIKGKGIGILVTMMYVNNTMFEDYKMEILEQSPTRVKFRSNRPYMEMFDKNLMLYGTSLAEYEKYRALNAKNTAAYLGFDYQEVLDGGWLVVTITKKT